MRGCTITVTGYMTGPVPLSVSSKLSKSLLDKHDRIQMNSESLCSARLAPSAIMWSFHWEQSSAPSRPLLTLGELAECNDLLAPILSNHLPLSFCFYISLVEMNKHYSNHLSRWLSVLRTSWHGKPKWCKQLRHKGRALQEAVMHRRVDSVIRLGVEWNQHVLLVSCDGINNSQSASNLPLYIKSTLSSFPLKLCACISSLKKGEDVNHPYFPN